MSKNFISNLFIANTCTQINIMNVCNACNKTTKVSERIKCSVTSCAKCFHLVCVNVAAKKIKQTEWRCPSCISCLPRGDNSNTPVRQQQPEDSPSDSTYVTRQNMEGDGDTTLKDELMAMMRDELPGMVRKAVNDVLKQFKKDVQELQNSLAYIHAEYADLKKGYDAITTDNGTLTKKCQELETKIISMEYETAKQQQWSRLQNLEFVGVPECKDESLTDLVTKIADHAGVSLRPDEIDFAHRVKPRREVTGRPRSIVLRLKQRLTKDKLLSAVRRCRGISTTGIGMSGETRNIYINEHLTPSNKMLLRMCKNHARENGYKYVWTKNCRIYVRKHEKAPPVLVLTESDLKRIT